LYVGRLTQDKGILDLTRAFLRLAIQNSNIHLLIVGPEEEDIKKKIEDLCVNITNRIHFSGYSNNPEHYMAASDILCLPSYREGFGLVLIEAAAVGIPTVGSRIYGIIDAIQDGITGLLFRKGDIKDLTEKISIILKNKKLAKSLGNAGRQRVRRNFDYKLILNDLLKFYENLLKKNFS
jgi:glycosyltransferase involved in cell wall biosynthesis